MKPRETLDAIKQVSQLSGAIWAIEERAGNDLKARVEAMDLTAHVEAQHEAISALSSREMPAPRPGAFNRAGDVAVVEILGVMTKYGTSLGPMRHGTIGVRRAIRQAADDDGVSGILLVIDSAGGTVAGTGDLADEVAQAAARKPVVAFIEDMGASAAYWVASQASRIVANRTALVGSIGTYLTVEDTSARAAAEGIKVHVVKAGTFKGLGVDGTPVTDGHLAELQRLVDSINSLFVEAVAAGRRVGRETARHKWADGRVHSGEQAEALGLIDGIATREVAIAELAGGKVRLRSLPAGLAAALPAIEPSAPVAPPRVAPAPAKPKPAAPVEPKDPNKYRLSRHERSQCAGAALTPNPIWKEIGMATTTTRQTYGSALAEWNALIEAKVAAGMDRMRATSAVARERPELREALIREANANRARR